LSQDYDNFLVTRREKQHSAAAEHCNENVKERFPPVCELEPRELLLRANRFLASTRDEKTHSKSREIEIEGKYNFSCEKSKTCRVLISLLRAKLVFSRVCRHFAILIRENENKFGKFRIYNYQSMHKYILRLCTARMSRQSYSLFTISITIEQ